MPDQKKDTANKPKPERWPNRGLWQEERNSAIVAFDRIKDTIEMPPQTKTETRNICQKVLAELGKTDKKWLNLFLAVDTIPTKAATAVINLVEQKITNYQRYNHKCL